MYAIKKSLGLCVSAIILCGGGGTVIDHDINQNTHAIHISTFASAPSYQLTALTWLPDYDENEKIWGKYVISTNKSGGGDNSNHGRETDGVNRCSEAGYTITSCPEGSFFKESERCPYSLDKSYYKECYSRASVCIETGYTTSCSSGYEVDKSRVCPQDSTYTKCKPAECTGYEYTQAEANATGYVADGEPCQSGGEMKYKRKPNPCTGYNYDSSNCGVSSCGTLSGDTCLSGTVKKYKTCEACSTPKTCSSGQVDLDTYWCNGALKCWWK